MSRHRLIGALTVVAFAAAPAAAQAATITWSGSTSVTPLAIKVAKAYNKPKGYFAYKQGGSDVGINDVARGRVDIGLSSRDPRSGDPDGLVFTRVANDGLCIVTHKTNRVRNLSTEGIQAIFSGAARDWSRVPGATVKGTVSLFTRTQASGSQDAFQNIFMGDRSVSRAASQQRSSGLVAQRVRSNPRGAGYLSFAFSSGLNVPAYKGVSCTLRNAKSGLYGGLRRFYYVTRGQPSGPVAQWIKFIKTSSAARNQIATQWVPIA